MNDLIDRLLSYGVAFIPIGIAVILMIAINKLAKKKVTDMGHRAKGALALIFGFLFLLSTMLLLVRNHTVYFLANICTFTVIFAGLSCFIFVPNKRDTPVDKSNKNFGLIVSCALGAVIGLVHSFALSVTEWYPALLIELCALVGIR
jgi:hypothetical protein